MWVPHPFAQQKGGINKARCAVITSAANAGSGVEGHAVEFTQTRIRGMPDPRCRQCLMIRALSVSSVQNPWLLGFSTSSDPHLLCCSCIRSSLYHSYSVFLP